MFEIVVSQLAVVALFIKRVVDLLKPLYQYHRYQAHIDQALATGISIILCIAWNVNLLDAAEILVSPVIGQTATGLVASLGANVLNEVIALLKLLKEKNLPEWK